LQRRESSAFALLLLLASGCATRPATSTVTVTSMGQRRGGPARAIFEGRASWYGKEQHGHLTASGEHFDMYALTAAHRTLHMNTRVRVVNLLSGRDVIVRINDRGPYGRGRIIDLSYAAAKIIGMLNAGVVPVRLEVLP
jgi:rare lipoprotein A